MTSPQAPDSAERSFDRIVALLERAKLSGSQQATAPCPVCRSGSTNRKHNLSVTYFPQLRETKTHCFSAECTRNEVLDALGLPHWAAHDDEPRPCEVCSKLAIPDEDGRYIHDYCAAKHEGRRVPPRRRRDERAKSAAVTLPQLPDLIAEPPARKYKLLSRYQVVAEWEHVELTGELVARSVRKERTVLYEGDTEPTVEKVIRPHYFDPANGGRWCNTKASSPVESVPLWRLPEVRKAITDGVPVWGSEGHKAAEAVVAVGGCGTTVLLGSLDPEAAQGLAGADWRYICDRDATGYAKGLKAMAAVEGLAAHRSLWLPAVLDEPGADAADHFKAGYRLDQLIPTDIAHVEVLQLLATARGGEWANGRLKHADTARIDREARAWLTRAESAEDRDDADSAAAARANAQLWVRASGQRLRQLLQLSAQLQQLEAASEADLDEMAALVANGVAFARELHAEFDLDVDEDLVAAIAPPPAPPSGSHAGLADGDDDPEGAGRPEATVYAFPAPEPGVPRWVLSVPGDWRFDDGSNARRGVYNSPRRDETFYVRMAPLPYVHARVVRRDGRGNVAAVDLLLSATEDGPQLTITRDELGDGRWASRLGIPLSWDPKVRQAAATAIEDYANRVAPERESIPRIGEDSGLLEIPVDLCDQLFRAAPCDRQEGLRIWREIIDEATRAPKLAHLIGASVIAPFSRSISRTLPHWVSLTGPMGRGKTQALKLAAGVWGDSVSRDTAGSLYGSWSASHQAVPQMLGELNVMPTFLDEAGATGYTKQQWGQLIYRISLGASRKRTNVREGRVTQERSWHSILFTSANDQLTAGIDSGVFQGTIRRVVEIPAPPTADRDQGNRLVNDDPFTPGLLQQCYGHLGLEVASTVTVQQAARYLQRARALLETPEGDAGEIAALLQLHLAGALLVDELLGTGQQLTDAALGSVQDVLADWLPGQSEGDRVLDLVRECTGGEPNCWMTPDSYDEAFSEMAGNTPGDRHKVIIKQLYGLLLDDGWIAVLPSVWARFLAEANVSPGQAMAELEDRGLLIRNDSAKNRNHTYQTLQRFGRGRAAKPQRVYKVYLPDPEDENDDTDIVEPPTDGSDAPPQNPQQAPSEAPDQPALTGDSAATRGVTGVTGDTSRVTGGVTGQNMDLTRGVTGVTGSALTRVNAEAQAPAREDQQEDNTMAIRYLDRGGNAGWSSHISPPQPCVVCGMSSAISIDAMPIHPLCWERSTRGERAQNLVGRPPQMPAAAPEPAVGPEPGWAATTPPYPDCVVCGTPSAQALASMPLHRGECEDKLAQRQAPVAPPAAPRLSSAGRSEAGPRFAADSAVLDVTDGWLSTGVRVGAPDPVRHAGDIATWAIQQRLGYGGNRHHRPEPGHVWLTNALCARLGLPVGPTEDVDVMAQALTVMRTSSFFTDAERDGWEVIAATAQPWLRLRRDKITVIVTGVGWGMDRYDDLLSGNPDAQQLAGRLGYLCNLIGYPYSITLPQTGVQMLAYHTTHGLPPVTIPAGVEFNDVGARPSWLDLEQLQELVEAHPDWWAHKYDRRASYAASAGSAILGTGPGMHVEQDCVFDKRVAGIYRIAPLAGQPLPQLAGFDLRDPLGHGHATGWVSRAVMQYLIESGVEARIEEAYVWDTTNSGAQLKGWQARIREARAQLGTDVHADVDAARAIADAGMFKTIYSGAIGNLAATKDRLDVTEPAWRYYPHWRAEILGTHIVNTLRAVARIAERDPQHRLPIGIGDTDAIVYVGPSADPADVWPGQGDDSLSNPALGKFVPHSAIQLGAWEQAFHAQKDTERRTGRIPLIGKAGRKWQ